MSFDLLGIFGAGLLTFVTPCVLPLVPVYLLALVGGSVKDLAEAQRGPLIARALPFPEAEQTASATQGEACGSLGDAPAGSPACSPDGP